MIRNIRTIAKVMISVLYSVLLIVPFVLMASPKCSAADISHMPRLEEITITSQYSDCSLRYSTHDVKTITNDDIARLHASSLIQVLETYSPVHFSERGSAYSQSDVTIKGSSFEGVLLFINGIPFDDPQTGHFTMDLPVALADVEQIEVISSGGASLYGSSTSGGVINIITKRPEGYSGGLSLGSHESLDAHVSYGKNISQMNLNVSMHGARSAGYRKNLEYQYLDLYSSGSYKEDKWSFIWFGGLVDKEYGAENFYALSPSYEKTLTLLGGFTANRLFSDGSIVRIRCGGRGHDDDFVLNRNKPNQYHNTHFNRTYTAAVEYFTALRSHVDVLAGSELIRTGITSGRLGSHTDLNGALYGKVNVKTKRSDISCSIRYDRNSEGNEYVSPRLGLLIPLNKTVSFMVNSESMFRTPTYTERSYISPVNKGNPRLKSEQSLLYNAGLSFLRGTSCWELSSFFRKSTDAIDWVLFPGETVWETANHGVIKTVGWEISMQKQFAGAWQGVVDAQFLRQTIERKKGVESKYFNPLAATVAATITGEITENVHCALLVRYEDELHGESRTPVTVTVSRRFPGFRATLSVRNMFNEKYDEITGLPSPGRWFEARMEYNQ